MIGPVMIGPSSSHTGGVVRIGRVAKRILGEIPKEATITFYNSFARTYEGHGSDKAIIAGLMDFKTDDERIKQSMEIATQRNLKYAFRSVGNTSTFHPNTVKVEIKGTDKSAEVIGESRGGGVIRIKEVNGYHANFTASLHTLILIADDVKASIAFIASVISRDDCNIATLTASRDQKAGNACLIFEMDSGLKDITVEYLRNLDWVQEVKYIPNIE